MIKCINFWEGRHQISLEEATWNFGWFVDLEHEVLDWVLSFSGMRIISEQTPVLHQSLGFFLILRMNLNVIWIGCISIFSPSLFLRRFRRLVGTDQKLRESSRAPQQQWWVKCEARTTASLYFFDGLETKWTIGNCQCQNHRERGTWMRRRRSIDGISYAYLLF